MRYAAYNEYRNIRDTAAGRAGNKRLQEESLSRRVLAAFVAAKQIITLRSAQLSVLNREQ